MIVAKRIKRKEEIGRHLHQNKCIWLINDILRYRMWVSWLQHPRAVPWTELFTLPSKVLHLVSPGQPRAMYSASCAVLCLSPDRLVWTTPRFTAASHLHLHHPDPHHQHLWCWTYFRICSFRADFQLYSQCNPCNSWVKSILFLHQLLCRGLMLFKLKPKLDMAQALLSFPHPLTSLSHLLLHSLPCFHSSHIDLFVVP